MSQTLPEWVARFFGSTYASANMPWPEDKKARISGALMDVLELKPGKVALDQCCGEGHLALALAARGLRVYGVDQSADYIQKANQLCENSGHLDAHFEAADAALWYPPEQVDAAISWHTSIGYGGKRGAEHMIGALRRPLKREKLWLMELRNLKHYRGAHPLHFSENFISPEWGEATVERIGEWDGNDLIQHWRIHQEGKTLWTQNDTRCWHPSIEEIHALVRSFGDRIVDIYADVDRSALSDRSPRMTVLVRKVA